MSSVDERVVRMEFQNDDFKRRALETLQALANVNKGIEQAGKSGKGLFGISDSMSQVTARFTASSAAMFAVVGNLTNRVVNAGLQMTKSLTITPITSGFQNYEQQINALQTILANVSTQGSTLGDVKKALAELNVYANKTIYDFRDMATNVGTFTAAGVNLKDSVASVKGLSNVAALAGAGTQQAAGAMYQLSQALGRGKVQAQDWNSVVAAGMASSNFKNALLETAKAVGTIKMPPTETIADWTKKGNSFQSAMEAGAITSGVLTQTLSVMTGDMTNAQLKAEGYNKTQIKSLQTIARLGASSATNVKTFSQLMDNLKQTVASSWATIFKDIFGGLKQSTSLFTSLSGALTNFFTAPLNGLDKFLQEFNKLGGRKIVIQSIVNIFTALGAILKPIGEAFREIFPPKTAASAIATAQAFESFTEKLKPSAKTVENLKRTFAGFFAILDIGKQLIGSIIGAIFSLGGSAGKSSGGFLALTARIGDFLVGLDEALKKGQFFQKFFDGIASVLKDLGGAIGSAAGHIHGINVDLSGFIKNISLGKLAVVGITTAIVVMAVKFFGLIKSLSGVVEGFAGIGSGFANILGGAGDALKSFQTQARAKLILDIGIAVGILAASLFLLSLIPSQKAANALLEMGTMMLMLTLFMKAMLKLDIKGLGLKLAVIGASLLLVAGAMATMAIAMAILDHVGWDGIVKGLAAMGGMVLAMRVLGDISAKGAIPILAGAAAIAAISASMLLLAGALIIFGGVKWDALAKAGVALAGIVVAVTAMSFISSKGMLKLSVAMVALSGSMLLISAALLAFNKIKWESIAKAGVVLAGLVVALLAMSVIGKAGGALTFVAIAAAMMGIASAALIMNKVDWSSIGKIGAIFAGLIVGVAALLAIAEAFAPAILAFAALAAAIGLMGLGLGALAAAIAVLIPVMAIGGAALTAFAVGAVAALAAFLAATAAMAPQMAENALTIINVFLGAILNEMPTIIAFGASVIVEFLNGMAQNIGSIIAAGSNLIVNFLKGLAQNLPGIINAASTVIVKFLNGISKNSDRIVTAGSNLIISLINGLSKNLGGILNAAGTLIAKFIQGIGAQASKIAKAAGDTVITFINATADQIRTQGPALGDAMSNLGIAMVQGLIGGIGAMFGNAMDAIGKLAQGMVDKAKGILKIFSPSRVFKDIGKFLVQGLTQGIQDNAVSAITSVASMVSGQIAVASSYISGFIQSLDQQALAAKAKADGLAAAADKAQKAASKTKNKRDDKSADRLGKQADKASKEADKVQAKADAAKAAQDRADQFAQADTLTKAQMRSEDAQSQLDASKASEQAAAKDLAEANALDRQAKAKGVNAKEREKLQKQADELRAKAKQDAANANAQLAAAKQSAADALAYQKQAGDEAAAAFQAAFDADAKAAADAAAFDKLSNADKAAMRRQQAEDLQAQAQKDLDAAKQLAYTDLDKANQLAQQANDEASRARQYLQDAQGFSDQAAQGTAQNTVAGTSGSVVNLDGMSAAAIAFNQYNDLFDSATAALAASPTVQYNQYNTSPEALDPTTIYRQTNNLLTHRAESLVPAA